MGDESDPMTELSLIGCGAVIEVSLLQWEIRLIQ